MTIISRLKVSLTKHNAHKVASLLKKYDASQVLDHLDEVQAEKAQAYKNLSIQPGNKIPTVWSKAKEIGPNAIDALVLVGIIFSHHQLIDAMINASNRSGLAARIRQGDQIAEKAYTNFARILDQLGYATKRDDNSISFNLKPMFEIQGFGKLVGELLEYKLSTANWNRNGAVEDEAIAHNFHAAFGLSTKEFREWITKDAKPASTESQFLPKDEEFFQMENEGLPSKPFQFRPGHEERSAEPVSRGASARTQANRLHNDIQNRLYAHLQGIVGENNVGTEVDTGNGTSIDAATRYQECTTFYEIKTGRSVRSNIRQAIPQLLEYAYWPDGKRADELVIVSHLPITKAAERYLVYLRERFELPIFYRQFDMTANRLV